MTRFSWLALGVGAYVAFVLAAISGNDRVSLVRARLFLAGINGTIWSGSAAAGSLGGVPLRDLRWDVSALPLLIGRLSGELQARLADGLVSSALSASPSRVTFSDLAASTSLAALRRRLAREGNGRTRECVAEHAASSKIGWPTEIARRDQPRASLRSSRSWRPCAPSSSGSATTSSSPETGGEGLAGSFRDTGGPLEVSGTLALMHRARVRARWSD